MSAAKRGGRGGGTPATQATINSEMTTGSLEMHSDCNRCHKICIYHPTATSFFSTNQALQHYFLENFRCSLKFDESENFSESFLYQIFESEQNGNSEGIYKIPSSKLVACEPQTYFRSSQIFSRLGFSAGKTNAEKTGCSRRNSPFVCFVTQRTSSQRGALRDDLCGSRLWKVPGYAAHTEWNLGPRKKNKMAPEICHVYWDPGLYGKSTGCIQLQQYGLNG